MNYHAYPFLFDGPRAVITVHSGARIDLLHPNPEQIAIDDIAHALSRINRFGGATVRTYTVAEHLLLGLEQMVPAHRLRWMCHDFAEAYLGDVVGPLKRAACMSGYRELEERWEGAVAQRFGVPAGGAREVATVDGRMLATELRDLMGVAPLSTDRYRPYALRIEMKEPSPDWLKQTLLATMRGLERTRPLFVEAPERAR